MADNTGREIEPYHEEEPESPEEALALMVGRLHPKIDVQEYLTILRSSGEVNAAAKLKAMGEILKEANHPSAKTMYMLGINPLQTYKVRRFIGVKRIVCVEQGRLVAYQQDEWQNDEVDSIEYTKNLILNNRGIAQALVLLTIGQKLDNYRVAREGIGRTGGIRIAGSMISGKQDAASGSGFLMRFRRALGKKE